VHPDVRAKAGGRGAWLAVGRPELERALAKGKLQGQLRRAFRADAVTIAPDLPERAEVALRQAALDRLGMEAKAGNLLTGSERIEALARSGGLYLLLHASDAGEDGRGKLAQAWRVGGGEPQGLVLPADRTILSMALGRENVVHIGVSDKAAAARIRLAAQRWLGFSNGTGLLPGGDASPGEEGFERVA